MQCGMAKVGIDEEHVTTGLRHDDSQVDGGCRLAFVGGRAHHHHGLDWAIDAAKADVCSEGSIGFGKPGVKSFVRQQQSVLSRHHAPPFIARKLCGLALGMTPITGAPTISSAASGSRTVVSRYSRKNTNRVPRTRASAPAERTSMSRPPDSGRATA